VAIVDVTAGLYAATGILAALQARSTSGHGQRVEVNLLDAAAGWLANVAANYLATGTPPGRYGNAHPNIVPYQVFAAADGYLAVGVGNDAQWRRLCAVLERPDLGDDPRYTANAGRQQHRDELIAALSASFAARPIAAWVTRLDAAGIPAGPINTVDKVFETPGLLNPGMLSTLPHPTAGTVRVVGTPIGLSATPAYPRSAPPTLGQHSAEVLRDWLGLDDAEIAALRDTGVV
jgi:crotonobetainyl-CoA:carnitine CoA-transferase CaiB-like acyl-CoA transferase